MFHALMVARHKERCIVACTHHSFNENLHTQDH
jgi:hypothetical protein